jgi:asparagine synthase (glutamine-hydrolysing)
MAVGVEARVPFMDVELMRLCARIPEHYKLHDGVTKYILKKSMERYLPHDLIYRSKTGFGVPLRKWIRTDLKDVIRELIGPESIAARGLLEPAFVQRIIDENAAGRADHGYLIYALLTLEVWMRSFVDQPGVEISF